MTRTTITLSDDDMKRLEQLKKAHGASASKVLRAALRRFHEEAATRKLEEAYREFYAEEHKDIDKAIHDFALLSAEDW